MGGRQVMTSGFGLKAVFFEALGTRVGVEVRGLVLEVDEVEQLAIVRWDAIGDGLTMLLRLLVDVFGDGVEVLLDEWGELVVAPEDAASFSKLSVF